MYEFISKFASSRPRKGSAITYMGKPHGVVDHVEDALCWNRYKDGDEEICLPFIWCFHDGLNNLHDWPGKHKDDEVKFK